VFVFSASAEMATHWTSPMGSFLEKTDLRSRPVLVSTRVRLRPLSVAPTSMTPPRWNESDPALVDPSASDPAAPGACGAHFCLNTARSSSSVTANVPVVMAGAGQAAATAVGVRWRPWRSGGGGCGVRRACWVEVSGRLGSANLAMEASVGGRAGRGAPQAPSRQPATVGPVAIS